MRKNKFRRVKIDQKLFPIWGYGIYLLFLIGVPYMLIYSIRSRDGGMITVSLFVVAIIVGLHILYFKFKSGRWIENKLRWLVETNRWYESQTLSDGTKQFTYLPDIRYMQTAESLYISFDLDGSAKSKQYRGLKTQLKDCFNMACASVNETNGQIIYELVDDSYFEPLQADENTDYSNFCNEERVLLGKHMTWNWRSAPHGLITGGTGSGKSYFLLFLFKCFNSIHADIRIIDPKKSDLYKLGIFLSVPTACEPNQIAKLLRETEEVMDQRYMDMEQIGADYYTLGLNPCFIFFDEAMAFSGGSADEKLKKECRKALLSIVAKGRQAGVNVILSAQRPDTEFLGGGAVRDQLGMRVALGNLSRTGIEMVYGNDYKDIKPRFSGKGEGLIYVDGFTHEPMEFKTPRLRNAWVIK